jgi:hypothetical protein
MEQDIKKIQANSYCYFWSTASYAAKTWTLQKVDKQRLESFEMWCWRRLQKISWTNHAKNEKVLRRVEKEINILRANWFVMSCIETVFYNMLLMEW